MSGIIVHATHLDSVRIVILGASRALTIPLSLVVDLDDALKLVRESDGTLTIRPGCSVDGWVAECGRHLYGEGPTPLQALANLKQYQPDHNAR